MDGQHQLRRTSWRGEHRLGKAWYTAIDVVLATFYDLIKAAAESSEQMVQHEQKKGHSQQNIAPGKVPMEPPSDWTSCFRPTNFNLVWKTTRRPFGDASFIPCLPWTHGGSTWKPRPIQVRGGASNLEARPAAAVQGRANVVVAAAAAPPAPRSVLRPGPPLPLPAPSKGLVKSASPLPPLKNGAAPPPPPPGTATTSSYTKKATTRLRRSAQIASLYRLLKAKIEGSNPQVKSNSGRKHHDPGSSGGKQGMADALAEMTKRSDYFQKIETDVQTHGRTIMDLKAKINSFHTKDTIELLKFHDFIESHLDSLTDETQVLARFEGFPEKKLEALRAAAAMCSKLDAIAVRLQNWEIVPPLGNLLDQIESYFSKERRAAKEKENDDTATRMLWRVFQFAFQVYSFAGGHDDRADKLSKELAHEIETSS